MTDSVSISSPVQTDKKILKQRLTQREVAEQTRLALLESVKNNPDKWLRMLAALSVGYGAYRHTLDLRGDTEGSRIGGAAKAGLMISALLVENDRSPLLALAGAQEILDYLTGGGSGALPQQLKGATSTTAGLPLASRFSLGR